MREWDGISKVFTRQSASAMIVSNSNLDGIWAVWDQPAEGVMEAARANGKDDLIITTIDLGENVAISIGQLGKEFGLIKRRIELIFKMNKN